MIRDPTYGNLKHHRCPVYTSCLYMAVLWFQCICIPIEFVIGTYTMYRAGRKSGIVEWALVYIVSSYSGFHMHEKFVPCGREEGRPQ